jgi:uncharacterized protein with beta-barrel porin domain
MRDKRLRGPSNAGCEPATSSYRRSGAIARRSVLLGGTAAMALMIGQPVRAISINDGFFPNQAPTRDTASGFYDNTNQFPNVAAPLLASGQTFCTGSLINSRTVLIAAHCDPSGLQLAGVSFNAIASSNDPNFRGITSWYRNTDYNSTTQAGDIAVISLSRPITTIPFVTYNGTVPQPGTLLFAAGYGGFGVGSDCCNLGDNKRRVVTTEFGAYASGSIIGYGSATFLLAQFRDPANLDSTIPNNNPNNVFNLTVPTSTREGGTVAGDSGSPVFIMTANGLVQIGVLSGGGNPAVTPPPNSDCRDIVNNPCGQGLYGDGSAWTPLALYLEWLAENNPLRDVTAARGNFMWSNPAVWIDPFHDPANPDGAVPDNTRGVVDIDANKPARYYNVKLSNVGTITLDMSPQIDTLSIEGAQSELIIGAPYTLEVLLGTKLSNGTLTMASGTLATSEFLMSGGLLTGGGTIGGSPNFQGPCGNNVCVSVTGGTVAPIGTLNIQGNYTQTGGLLEFQLAPTGANGRLAVTNTATLGGTSTLGVTVTPGLYGLSTPYALLTAGAISGQFAQFISVSPPSRFLSLSGLTYNPTSIDVTVTRTPFGALAGLTANQRAVGNALEGAYNTALTGPAAQLYTNLLMTGTPEALSQLSGEGTTAAQNTAFASGRMFDSLLMDQGAFWRSGETADSEGVTFREAPLAYAAEKPAPAVFKALKAPPPAYQPRTWRIWTGGFGGVQSFNGDASVGSADARTAAAGGAMGFDYQVDPTRLVGVAVGGSESHFSVPDRATSGDLLGGHVGAYGVATWGALYAAGVLSYSRFDNDVRRTIAGVGPSETPTGRFASDLLGARLELGRSYALPWVNVTPFAAVQTSTLWERGFSESSSAGALPGILGLTYQSQSATSLPTFLGVQLDTRLTLYNMVWSPFMRTAWVHEFRPNRSLAASFESVPGTLFAVDGARAWSDALKVNAGSRLAINQYASLFASFDGEFANSGHSYAGRGGIRFSW